VANELTVNGSLSCSKIPPMSAAVARNITGGLVSVASGIFSEGVISIATSATAFPLGGITSCGWAFFYNSDVVNYITLRNGAAGADFMKLAAGEWMLGPLLPACVPYGLANTTACLVEFLIFSR